MADVDVTLVERLENWGRWAAVGQGQGISITGMVCRRLARDKGQLEAAREARIEVDELDAVLVERAWVKLGPTRIERLAGRTHSQVQQLLAGYYILTRAPVYLHVGQLARKLGIYRSEWESALVKAHWAMSNRLTDRADPVKNAGDNLNETSSLLDPRGDARPKQARAA
jgi:hypothetical protein